MSTSPPSPHDAPGSEFPRERVEFRVARQTDEVPEELPFRVLVIGDFTQSLLNVPLRERTLVGVTRETFNTVLAAAGVTLDIPLTPETRETGVTGATLRFEKLSDFSPGSIVQQVPHLRELIEVRQYLNSLKSEFLTGSSAPWSRRILDVWNIEKLESLPSALGRRGIELCCGIKFSSQLVERFLPITPGIPIEDQEESRRTEDSVRAQASSALSDVLQSMEPLPGIPPPELSLEERQERITRFWRECDNPWMLRRLLLHHHDPAMVIAGWCELVGYHFSAMMGDQQHAKLRSLREKVRGGKTGISRTPKPRELAEKVRSICWCLEPREDVRFQEIENSIAACAEADLRRRYAALPRESHTPADALSVLGTAIEAGWNDAMTDVAWDALREVQAALEHCLSQFTRLLVEMTGVAEERLDPGIRQHRRQIQGFVRRRAQEILQNDQTWTEFRAMSPDNPAYSSQRSRALDARLVLFFRLTTAKRFGSSSSLVRTSILPAVVAEMIKRFLPVPKIAAHTTR